MPIRKKLKPKITDKNNNHNKSKEFKGLIAGVKKSKAGNYLKSTEANETVDQREESKEKVQIKETGKKTLSEGDSSQSENNPRKKEKTKNTKRGKKRIKRPKKPRFPQIQLRGNYVVEIDLDKNKIERKVSTRMQISEIQMNIDTQEIKMILDYDYRGQNCHIEIDRSYFTKRKILELQRYGVDVYEFNADNVIKHLVNQEIIADQIYTHSQVGMFKDEEGNYTFRHYKAKGEITSSYAGQLKLKPKGTKEEKLRMIKENVLGRPPLELIMAVAFSSALVGFISEDTEIDNPIIHLSGDSTTGKSTALMLAASLYGSPNPREKGIFSTWNSTKNALIAKLRDNRGILAVFDEASMSKIKDFTDVIYMLAAGSDKERLNKNAEMKDKKEWSTTILSNGEHSLTSKSNQNTGTRMRKLEFSNIEWTESAEHSDTIKQKVLKNYGYLGVEFGNALISMGKDQVVTLFRKWIDACHDKLDKDDIFSKRLSKPMALIMTSAEIARDKLNIMLNIENILEFLINTQNNNRTSNNIDMRAYEYFLDIYTRYSEKFVKEGRLNNDEYMPKEIWGKYVSKTNGTEQIVISIDVFKDTMSEGGFEDIDVILSKWRDKGLLDCDKNRYTRKRSVGGIKKRMYVVKVVDDFFTEEENKEANKVKKHKIKNRTRKKTNTQSKMNKLFSK